MKSELAEEISHHLIIAADKLREFKTEYSFYIKKKVQDNIKKEEKESKDPITKQRQHLIKLIDSLKL